MNRTPQEWQSIPLGEIVETITTGKTPSTQVEDYFNGDVNWFTPSDIGKSKYLNKSKRTLTKKAISEAKAAFFEENTLLITCIGDIGRVGILCNASSANQQITGIKFKQDVDVNYAYYWFLHNSYKLVNLANNAVVPILNNAQLKGITFQYPLIAIQKTIASILDKADSIRKKRRQQIKLADEFLRSTFLEMFGDPVSNPLNWQIIRLEDLLYRPTQSGLYVPKEDYTENTGIKMVHMSDVFYEIVSIENLKKVKVDKKNINRYLLDEDDILIARRSLNVEGAAKPCLVPASNEKLIYESSLIRVSPNKNKILPIYLYYYFSNIRSKEKYVMKHITTSTISGINQSNLNSIQIVTPSIDLQHQFQDIVSRINNLKNELVLSFNESKNLFNSLMQKAFRGEL